ncbi:aminotransferase class III-fold pyridoxal phosphate-dependent enzyme [Pseudonocardia alaniniphila]|uniref:Aminotransferase class III-fold pyridoxal phosphate-dependent enzyme n=1 Tax=Pseudonocardia alaniniphila TaxID=75291 RepID=A0ABS9TAZ5_9PSEU|nr:aminotransferase class III-fold pyridoxal phosphate-dependent enzyme [Pseudonocardia alaniniphila]MCH6165568.1 aminotransferase class III-fold pyridoxal phosphate-dependent enzyme [Pseudonocardia alaniniphila]
MEPFDIETALKQHYGLDVAEQEVLGGESDHNVRIVTVDGRQFLLKASAGSIDDVSLRWQADVLSHLADRAPDLPVSRLVPATSGAELVSVGSYAVRLLTWLPGTLFAEIEHHPPALLTELGRVAGRLTRALADLPVRAGVRSHHWDVRKAATAIDAGLGFVPDERNRRTVEHVLTWFDRAGATLDGLPTGVVHQDMNDFNVLVLPDGDTGVHVSGVLDVGDALFTIRVAEVAIAAAYAMLRKDDPLAAAAAVVAGFHSVVPLTDAELSVLFPLAAARLCVNATTWTRRLTTSDNRYAKERMRHTWPALARIVEISPALAEAAFRDACGFEPAPTPAVTGQAAVVHGALTELDLTPGSDLYDDLDWSDPDAVTAAIAHRRGRTTGVARHLTASLLHASQRSARAATVQLGMALFPPEGEPLRTPLAGVVERIAAPLVVRHDRVWTCWWGLEPLVCDGMEIDAGTALGTGRDGVQVQLVTSAELAAEPPPRWVRPDDVPVWSRLSPDPSVLLGLEPAQQPRMDVHDVVALREHRFGRSQRAYYRRPMNLVRGRGVWLYDENGFGYLDAINNVSHVGHAEPRVAAAAARQMSKLNTNSRFIYEGIAAYAERLCATLPAPLEVVFLVCTGSEANDLALRISRQVTGREDMIVIDGAYHGNTTAVTGISPNRYKGRGGAGAPPTTHEVSRPDRYRGAYGHDDPDAGAHYAAEVAATAARLTAQGRAPAGFIAESLMGTAGNIVLPDGYLPEAFAAVRAVGGLCISDEVQVGLGRLGEAFWGFELQGVVPDIVTMGKPLGNGHPMAAVVTTREIADAFDTGMKYFNTFGGNPVSCAIGQSVLDVVVQDGLQARAGEVGTYFLGVLEDLKDRHQLIGDVRGRGLYLGIELVRDRASKEPAVSEALEIAEGLKDRGVIVYPTGALDNVLKIKPPMVFGHEHVDLFAEALDAVLLSR